MRLLDMQESKLKDPREGDVEVQDKKYHSNPLVLI